MDTLINLTNGRSFEVGLVSMENDFHLEAVAMSSESTLYTQGRRYGQKRMVLRLPNNFSLEGNDYFIWTEMMAGKFSASVTVTGHHGDWKGEFDLHGENSLVMVLPPVLTGAQLIAEERTRQITKEGYDATRDANYTDGQLLKAAGAYLSAALERSTKGTGAPDVKRAVSFLWPWSLRTFKVADDPVRNLAKAGALIAAEIDRLQAVKK